MSKVFRIKSLSALNGDCIWIEYGEEDTLSRVLIDGGPVGAYPALRAEIERLPLDKRTFELLVVTHIDADHIDGIVKLMRHPELGAKFQEVWFNGWPQLDPLPTLAPTTEDAIDEGRGPVSGSYLDRLLIQDGGACNARFRKRAVCVADDGALPRVRLGGGLELTLLSPTIEKLRNLRTTWRQAFAKLGKEPGDADFVQSRLDRDKRFRGDEGAAPAVPSGLDEAAALAPVLDDAVANGSSIAFVAEYAGQRCALLGDAHAPLIEKSFRRMASARAEPKLRLAAVKLSHHGSKGNTTPGLMRAIDCRSYLVSTDGSVFHHPDDEAIQCVLDYAKPARLFFNYQSERTIRWSNTEPGASADYTTQYPAHGGERLEIDLLAPISSP
jgi:Metallo-beta-lactamase superfamily